MYLKPFLKLTQVSASYRSVNSSFTISFSQYEIEYDIDKPKYGYMTNPGGGPESLTKKQELRALGVWDVIFNREVVPVLEGAKHWEADHEDKLK